MSLQDKNTDFNIVFHRFHCSRVLYSFVSCGLSAERDKVLQRISGVFFPLARVRPRWLHYVLRQGQKDEKIKQFRSAYECRACRLPGFWFAISWIALEERPTTRIANNGNGQFRAPFSPVRGFGIES